MGKICAVILAAGRGQRMGAKINKLYLELDGKPILYYSIKAFSESSLIDEIIIVAAEDEIDYCSKSIVMEYGFKKVSKVVPGGKQRQDSVYNGLKALKECDIVLIHDGARPFVSKKIIEQGIKFAQLYGACACGVVPKDTIKLSSADKFSRGTLNRDELFCIQTPQCFKYNEIVRCHEKLKNEQIAVTDDTMVYEKFIGKVYLYNGSYDNIKITTREDLKFGNIILNS